MTITDNPLLRRSARSGVGIDRITQKREMDESLNEDLKQVNERLDQIERKLNNLRKSESAEQTSPGVRFLIGFGITIAIISILLLTLGVIRFVSNGWRKRIIRQR